MILDRTLPPVGSDALFAVGWPEVIRNQDKQQWTQHQTSKKPSCIRRSNGAKTSMNASNASSEAATKATPENVLQIIPCARPVNAASP